MPLPLPPSEPHHGTGHPFGWSATVRQSRAVGGNTVTVRRKGTRASALRAAALVPHAEAVVALESYDREAWARTFGEGRQ